MKKELFDENTTFEVIEGIRYMKYPHIPGCKEQKTEVLANKKLYTMIFTNGEIIYNGEKNTYHSKDLTNYGPATYKLNPKLIKFYDFIDEINIYNIQIKNADYVVKVLVGEEFLKSTHGGGFYHVIQNKEVYLKNPQNKEAKKIVKEILKKLQENNISLFGFDYPKIDFEKKKRSITVKVRKKERKNCL